jgi:hypothetical protein
VNLVKSKEEKEKTKILALIFTVADQGLQN